MKKYCLKHVCHVVPSHWCLVMVLCRAYVSSCYILQVLFGDAQCIYTWWCFDANMDFLFYFLFFFFQICFFLFGCPIITRWIHFGKLIDRRSYKNDELIVCQVQLHFYVVPSSCHDEISLFYIQLWTYSLI